MLPLKTILYSTDFGRSARAALRSACELARALSAELVLVHVINPTAFALATREASGAGAVACVPAMSGAIESARIALGKMESGILAQGLACRIRVALGSPAAAILQTARDERADLIVMGAPDTSWLRRILTVSPTEVVTRTSRCPVLVVPRPE